MIGPFLALAASSLSNTGASMALNSSALSEPDLKPKIGGYDPRPIGLVVGGLGLIASLAGGVVLPIIGGAMVGAGVASLTNYDAMSKVEKGLAEFAAYQQMRASHSPSPLTSAPIASITSGDDLGDETGDDETGDDFGDELDGYLNAEYADA